MDRFFCEFRRRPVDLINGFSIREGILGVQHEIPLPKKAFAKTAIAPWI